MCSDRVVVRVQGLGKKYRIYDRPIDRLKQMLWRGRREYGRSFTALEDVSFELQQGEVLGVVGRNGAGKSTLLQLLCGTLSPSSGSVHIHGRVAALLELGAGFNPEFTGRENVFLNAATLGLPRAEIERRFDEIVAFSGLGDFIDQPVQTYSSGMYVRLAFSIATCVELDVLVIDEALSVGDGEFARRSFDRIMSLKQRGTTILFCSHSLYQIEALCTRAIWIDKGRVQRLGAPSDVVAAYNDALAVASAKTRAGETAAPVASAVTEEQRARLAHPPRGFARIDRVTVSAGDQSGRELTLVTGETDLRVQIDFSCDPGLPPPHAAVTIHGMDSSTVCSAGTHIVGLKATVGVGGQGRACVVFPRFPLLKGRYFVSVHLLCEQGIHLYATADQVTTLEVSTPNLLQGLVSLPHTWTAEPLQPPEVSAHPARWKLAWLTRDDKQQWLSLFERAFGQTMAATFWDWKYRDTYRLGVGAFDKDDHLVAFYGGMPRQVWMKGLQVNAAQVGDVMAAGDALNGLARHSAFKAVATRFLEESIGHGRPHLIGFGFPSSKAMRLAERLGLYAPVDRLEELSWPVPASGPAWDVLTAPLSQTMAATVDRLWAEMAEAMPGSILGQRDFAYVQSRYLANPRFTYSVQMVTDANSGEALGVIVLHDQQGDGAELVDLLAPPARWPAMIDAARSLAMRWGRHRIWAWITESHGHHLAATGAQRRQLDIQIPANVWTPGPSVEELKGAWFLMAGDSDFR